MVEIASCCRGTFRPWWKSPPVAGGHFDHGGNSLLLQGAASDGLPQANHDAGGLRFGFWGRFVTALALGWLHSLNAPTVSRAPSHSGISSFVDIIQFPFFACSADKGTKGTGGTKKSESDAKGGVARIAHSAAQKAAQSAVRRVC